MAGFDPRPMILAGQIQRPEDGGWPLLNGHQTWFVTRPTDVGGLVRDAISWVNANPSMRVEPAPAPPVVLIQSWNELQEGAILIPTDESGYGFVRAIADGVGIQWRAPPKRRLRLTPSKLGRVTSTPAGISCPPRCTATFDEGVEVTLRARPAVGARKDGWSANCRITGPTTCSLIMVRDSHAQALITRSAQRRTIEMRRLGNRMGGTLETRDGFAPCAGSEPVHLQVRRGSGWSAVRSTVTDSRGRFNFRPPTRAGVYRARTLRRVEGAHTCLAATSKDVLVP